MGWDAIDWVLALAYVLLVVEITVFPVPSEASTLQILWAGGGTGSPHADALAQARTRPTGAKLLAYLLPTSVGVICFLIPPLTLFAPGVVAVLGPVSALATPTWRGVGIGCVVLGRLLTFLSVLQIRRAHRSGELQPRGLFTWSRNPGLVGMYVMYVGLCLVVPCVVLLIGFLPYVWNMHRRVLMEESHLESTVGASYEAYRGRVSRYLGRR